MSFQFRKGPESFFCLKLQRRKLTVERNLAVLIDSNPVRAADLYEAFIAAWYQKADEIHSEGAYCNFVVELASRWIRLRQVGGADRADTAKILSSWIDRDNYGFFNDLGSEAAKVLDRDGPCCPPRTTVGSAGARASPESFSKIGNHARIQCDHCRQEGAC